jgi:DNA polymerase-3 subunit epsilon
MSWADGRLVAFDVETTGTNVEEDRIVQAAVGLVGGGIATAWRTWLVNPGIEIPEEATAVHGITTERVCAEGVEASQAIREIAYALRSHIIKPVVVFNARFDLTILDRELGRYEGRPLTTVRDIPKVIDPLVIDKHLDRYRPGKRNLSAMAEHYGAELESAHDAASDAITAARLAWAIGKRGTVKRRVRDDDERDELIKLRSEWKNVRRDLGMLHAAQKRWAAEQAEGLERYFAEMGEPQTVERAWPVVPVREAV